MAAHSSPKGRVRSFSQKSATALDAGLGYRLTILTAASSNGWTAALQAWLQQRAHKAAWHTCCPQDNQPFVFLENLAQALQPVLALKTVIPVSWRNPEEAAIELLNSLTAAPDKTVIVLDSYEIIASKETHAITALLIEYLPIQVHLYIAARQIPPLPISHLRVRRQLQELREEDLG